MITISQLSEFQPLVGEVIGTSDWMKITSERVLDFAKATGDFQWIHLDEERCKQESPFGQPIAHGYLTLSLIPVLYAQLVEVKNIRMAINYGLNKTRFMKPVPVGAHIRLQAKVSSCEEIAGGIKVITTCTVELEGATKPACVAENIVLYYAQ